MICTACSTHNAPEARFCANCGATFEIDIPVPQSPNVRQDLVGVTIAGKYRLDAQLGVGGMGIVYRAKRVLIGDDVAVKILNSKLVSNEQMAERFRREAQAAARLKHPNVVTVYDFGVTADGLTYLVMELVEGKSLREIIKESGPISPSIASQIITQVCAALDEAHGQGIIHRDIKPDNIIVDSMARLRVKVLDFGIAKLSDATTSNLTQTGSVMGTPHYMSPEQCLGEELDRRSDIYALGIVLYEILCGVVPFNSPTSTAVVIQHVNQPPPPIRSINPNIPSKIEFVVRHALEKRREARPQTAGELAREFAAAADANSSSGQGWQSTPMHAEASHLGPGLTPTTVMSTPPSGSRYHTPHTDVRPVHGRQHSSRIVVLTALATGLVLGVGVGGAWLLLRGQRDVETNNTRKDVTAPDANRSTSSNQSPVRNDNNSEDLKVAPIATPTPSFAPSETRTEIMSVLDQWADSLRRQDVYGNLKFYADHLDVFYQLYDVDRDKVRVSRQAAFRRYYSSANVQLSDISIELDSYRSTAIVSYDSTYDWKGGTTYLNGKSRNEMILSKINGDWLITSEKHLQTYYEEKGN